MRILIQVEVDGSVYRIDRTYQNWQQISQSPEAIALEAFTFQADEMVAAVKKGRNRAHH